MISFTLFCLFRSTLIYSLARQSLAFLCHNTTSPHITLPPHNLSQLFHRTTTLVHAFPSPILTELFRRMTVPFCSIRLYSAANRLKASPFRCCSPRIHTTQFLCCSLCFCSNPQHVVSTLIISFAAWFNSIQCHSIATSFVRSRPVSWYRCQVLLLLIRCRLSTPTSVYYS